MISFAHLLQNILLLSTLIISSSCYHLVYDNSTSYNWNEAQSFCQSSYGTNLATAQTQQDLDELIQMRDAQFGDTNVYLFIGLNDQNQEGVYKWVSGESCDPNADGTLCVTYWKANEPSNSGGIEHCTELIYPDVNGISYIYDMSCDKEENQFFCDSPSQSQYHLVYDDSTSYSWTEAQSYCQSTYGSNLATAQTQEELNELIFMRDALFGNTNVYLFIGLNDQDEEGVFEWISGEECDPTATGTLCVTYWKANEPSNSGGNEHCTELIYPDVNNISYINDISCDREQQQFFCNARRYYLVYDSSTTYNWDEAQTYCETRYGTNLATAKTQQELNELISMRDRVFDTNVYLFIGLNDKNEEGVFEWISGEECDPIANADGTLCVTYWKQGEPSNSGGNEHCTELIYADVNGISYIYDMSCDKEENQFFCDAIIEPTLTFQPTKSPSEQLATYNPTYNPTSNPTNNPTTFIPTTITPTTNNPTTLVPTTNTPSTNGPTTNIPSVKTTIKPITANPSTTYPTNIPTNDKQIEIITTFGENGDESNITDTKSDSVTVTIIIVIVVVMVIIIVITIVFFYFKRLRKTQNKDKLDSNIEIGGIIHDKKTADDNDIVTAINTTDMGLINKSDDDIIAQVNQTDIGYNERSDEDLIPVINETDIGVDNSDIIKAVNNTHMGNIPPIVNKINSISNDDDLDEVKNNNEEEDLIQTINYTAGVNENDINGFVIDGDSENEKMIGPGSHKNTMGMEVNVIGESEGVNYQLDEDGAKDH